MPFTRSGPQYNPATSAVRSRRLPFNVCRTNRHRFAPSVSGPSAATGLSGSGNSPNISSGKSIASANCRNCTTS